MTIRLSRLDHELLSTMQRMVDNAECTWADIAATVAHHPAFSRALRGHVAAIANAGTAPAIQGDPFKGLPRW